MFWRILLACLAPFFFYGCTKTDCTECDAAIQAYYDAVAAGTCTADATDMLEKCGTNKGTELAAIMRETCHEGFIQLPMCENVGRTNMPFDLSVSGAISTTVNVEIKFGTESVDVDLATGQSARLTLPGFQYSSELTVTMTDASTGEVLFTGYPIMRFTRIEDNMDRVREIQPNFSNILGWRLFFWNFD